MWLNIDIMSAEQLLRSFNGQGFCDINEFTTTVITLAWIAFSIFVGQDRPLRLEDPGAYKVFGCDKLDMLFLTLFFLLNSIP